MLPPPFFFFLHHTSNPMIGGKSVSSGKEDSYGKGLDVASSWHSCIDPSGLTSDQHWEMEPHPLCLLADGWHTHEEKAAKAKSSSD